MTWKFVAGNLSLEFINTVGGRIIDNSGQHKILNDKLVSFDSLIDWACSINVISQSHRRKIITETSEIDASNFFKKAIELREMLYRIFHHIIISKSPDQMDLLAFSQELSNLYSNTQIKYRSNSFELDLGLQSSPEFILYSIILSAREVLFSAKLDRVKECPGDNCGWLFLDTSRNGKRTWCDMKDCGNLAKVRRYRARQK